MFLRKNMVCKLKKTIYNLKQSPRIEFDKFNRITAKLGFYKCYSDISVFIRRSSYDIIILAVYVDDILLIESDVDGIEKS